MSLVSQIKKLILNEYIRNDRGEGFRGHEFFKFVITKKYAQWIEAQIAEHIPDGYIIKKNMNLFTDTHGSQYLTINYVDGHYMTMRISTHHFTQEDKELPMYQINGWFNTADNIKTEVNEFIDHVVTYFNLVYKKKNGEDLSEHEKTIYNQVEKNIPFKSTENDKFLSLDELSMRGTKILMSTSKYKPIFLNP